MRIVLATRPGRLSDALLAEPPDGAELVPLGASPLAIDERAEALCVGGPLPVPFREVLDAFPRVRWIHAASAGVDRFLVPELLDRADIIVTNASDAHALPMAEFVVAAILSAAKDLPTYVRNHDGRVWPPTDRRPAHQTIRGATVVILGPGRIGREVARMARGLGMRVIAVRRRPELLGDADETVGPAELSRVAARADYLVVTAALTSETRGIVSRAVIGALPGHAWVVNVGRGAIVDQAALMEAIRGGRIGGAVLDALWEEPLPADSPWWDLPNVLVTGHASAGRSPELLGKQVAHFRENVRRYQAGEPLLNAVDVRAGY